MKQQQQKKYSKLYVTTLSLKYLSHTIYQIISRHIHAYFQQRRKKNPFSISFRTLSKEPKIKQSSNYIHTQSRLIHSLLLLLSSFVFFGRIFFCIELPSSSILMSRCVCVSLNFHYAVCSMVFMRIFTYICANNRLEENKQIFALNRVEFQQSILGRLPHSNALVILAFCFVKKKFIFCYRSGQVCPD